MHHYSSSPAENTRFFTVHCPIVIVSSSGTEIIAKLKKKEVEKKETEEVDEED